MTFLIVLVLVVLVVERWSVARALTGVAYDYAPSRLLVEPEEPFDIVTEVTNSSRRFVPFLRLVENLPAGATVHSENATVRTDVLGNLQHHSTLFLTPKSRLKRELTVTLPERGRYYLRGAYLSGGDFLGLTEEGRTVSLYREVVVFPREACCPGAMELLGGFLGDVSVRRFLIEDPVLTVGFREYSGREPMKAISWPHSARAGQLMVKQFDHTLEPAVSVLLDVEQDGGEREALVEQCFRLARSVCQSLEEKGVKYDFLTNAATANAFHQWSYIGEGLGRRHLLTILEGLGRATLECSEPLSVTARKAAELQEGNRSTVAVLPRSTPDKRAVLRELERRTGGTVHILSAEETMA